MSFGDGGIVVRPGEGKIIKVPGHSFTYKTMEEDTVGAYSLLEVFVTGGGSTQHIHKAEEEAFYVLDGEVNVKVGEQTIRGAAGTFVLIPRGTVHAIWNAGLTPAKFLVIISPAGLEQLWAEAGEETDPAIWIERVRSLGQKYNIEVVGPPLG